MNMSVQQKQALQVFSSAYIQDLILDTYLMINRLGLVIQFAQETTRRLQNNKDYLV